MSEISDLRNLRFVMMWMDSAPVVPAAREQPVQEHPAELGWSAASEASVVASVATEQ
ncbi:hypothetical protein F2Q68_00013742 [Brassica cretica]|uniref:Uncharacterized protein n=1 Tax=Brassica cretica TaxID=69181 RepID=A0A8S9HLR0_BRACR|nr:hypothetical protein F2Q68_00013742 [Brassica cretica]